MQFIKSLSEIRIIITPGGGFGHQAAGITLMERLRELGFAGIFDVRYGDMYPQTWWNDNEKESIGHCGRSLQFLLPGFVPPPIENITDPEIENDPGQVLIHPILGRLVITRMSTAPDQNFPHTRLTMRAADDGCASLLEGTKIFCTDIYIGLQPTDWEGLRFIKTGDAPYIQFPKNMRLASNTSIQENLLDRNNLSKSEQRVLDLASDPRFHTQLVYVLYDHDRFLSPKLIMDRLTRAAHEISKVTQKPVILFLPRVTQVVIEYALENDEYTNGNTFFIDLTKQSIGEEGYRPECVILAKTGPLQKNVFDEILLRRTTLPPLIEGVNSRSACEAVGRPFIYGGAKTFTGELIQYPVQRVDMQELHRNASLHLRESTYNGHHYDSLLNYIMDSLLEGSEVRKYHQERKDCFNARPDACEATLTVLDFYFIQVLLRDIQSYLQPFANPKTAAEYLAFVQLVAQTCEKDLKMFQQSIQNSEGYRQYCSQALSVHSIEHCMSFQSQRQQRLDTLSAGRHVNAAAQENHDRKWGVVVARNNAR